MKQTKTNAMRLLEREGLPYTPHEYETADGLLGGMSVAAKTGRDPNRVYKTLVCEAPDGGIFVFCIPVNTELALKPAAKAAGVKSLAMLPLARLLPVTGYVHGGCSPVGMKKRYPTFIEQGAFAHETILISGGRVGLQIEIAPGHLAAATGAGSFSQAGL